jgi:hypothetical protein
MRLVADIHVFVSAALKSASWPAAVVRWVDRRGYLFKTLETGYAEKGFVEGRSI